MNLKSLIRTKLPVVAHRTGIARVLAHRYRGIGTIFMLHSVVRDDEFHPDQTLRCKASSLDRLLGDLRRQGLDFISLDDALDRLNSRRQKPFAVFTFDDGFADNASVALPVMERHSAPFTVYVATGMLTGEIDAWWLGLAQLIRTNDRVAIKGTAQAWNCADAASKIETFIAIEALIHRHYDILPAVRATLNEVRIDYGALARAQGLTMEALAALARHPLVTIGAHTDTHINLALAPEATVRRELASNREFLESATGRPVLHVAYPFGNERACGVREARIASELGFRSAVTTRHGMLFPLHAAALHGLPRESLGNGDTASSLYCKINGFYRAAHSRFDDPVSTMAAETGATPAYVRSRS